jgi:hypothetical protein
MHPITTAGQNPFKMPFLTFQSPIQASLIEIRLSIFSAEIDTVSGKFPAKTVISEQANFRASASSNHMSFKHLAKPAQP